MVAVNVQGLLYCAHAALPHLLKAAQDEPRRVADMVNISSVAGRVTRTGSGVYNLTKHGVGAFSDSLRQEVSPRHVRISLVEPGAVDTELRLHNRPEIQEQMAKRFGDTEILHAEDIADAISVHGHAAAADGGQRDPDPAYRAVGLIAGFATHGPANGEGGGPKAAAPDRRCC